MAKSWKDADVNLDLIKNQTIAVIGYGIQGNAQANNLKDSGLNVIVGLQESGDSWKKAQQDGHQVMTIPQACQKADIIQNNVCFLASLWNCHHLMTVLLGFFPAIARLL